MRPFDRIVAVFSMWFPTSVAAILLAQIDRPVASMIALVANLGLFGAMVYLSLCLRREAKR